MRRLVVPACLCLITLSGTTVFDLTLPFENLSGVSTVNKTAETPATDSDREEADAARQSTSLDVNVGTIEIPSGEPLPNALPETAPLPPVPKPVIERSREEICDTLTTAAQSNDVPVPFFIRLLFQESGFDAGVVSSAGAQGIAQFMPETSASMGLDNPFDPLPAIRASARLLRNLFQQFGNLGLAAAAYNAGPKRIQEWLAKKGKLPQETQGYVKIITGRPAETWTAAEAGSPAVKLPRRAPCQEAAGLLAWNGPEYIPLPPTRTPASKDNTIVATRARATIARHATRVTPIIGAGKSAKSSASPAAKDAKEIKQVKGAIQLAASKHKQHRLRVSQR